MVTVTRLKKNTRKCLPLKDVLVLDNELLKNIIYGDTWHYYPLYINAYVRTIRYWIKITRMSVNRLGFKAHLMLLHLDKECKK